MMAAILRSEATKNLAPDKQTFYWAENEILRLRCAPAQNDEPSIYG